jgi:putative endonuclease
MNWFVYMILASDDQLYTGITTDIQRRWDEHTSGKAGAKYFRGRTPMLLCLLEDGHSHSTASQREAAIKKLNRIAKLQLINIQFNNTTTCFAQYEAPLLPIIKSALDL